MKTHRRAWRWLRVRVWAGVVAVLVLASAVCCLMSSFGRGHAPAPHGEANGVSELSDLVAAR